MSRRPPKKRVSTWARIHVGPKARKKLQIPEEEFYLQCLVAVGTPNPHARDFYYGQWEKGTYSYLKHTPAGRAFVDLLTTHGEAKSRAARWYYGYVRWYANEEETRRRKSMGPLHIHTPETEQYLKDSAQRQEGFATLLAFKTNGRGLRLMKIRSKKGAKLKLVLGFITVWGDGRQTFQAYAEVLTSRRGERPNETNYELVEVL